MIRTFLGSCLPSGVELNHPSNCYVTIMFYSIDNALAELIDLLKLWQGVDSLYEQSHKTAVRRLQLVKQGTLLDSEET